MSVPFESRSSGSARSGNRAVALSALGRAATERLPQVDGIDMAEGVILVAETSRRLAAVLAVDAMQAIEASREWRDQGHASARKMFAHLSGTSAGDAFQLDKIRRMIHGGQVPLIDKAWRSGSIGVEQAGLLGQAYANPRTRDQFIADQRWMLRQAATLPWARFQRRIARWVEINDHDGAQPRPDPSHKNRNVTGSQDHFSKAWNFQAQLGSLAGSRFNEIFNAYVNAEFATDWEHAKEELGEAACVDSLPRTHAQRRADALCQMAEDAVKSAAPSVRAKRTHNLVWHGESAEELFRRWFGEGTEPLSADIDDVTDLDGNTIHGHAAMADLITGSFRRAIRNAAGVTIDLSDKHRFYTGVARLAAELQRTDCYWPGCHLPVTESHIDHLRPAARGGRTRQQNGAPACPAHNRRKEAGYTVTRLPDGTLQITTPNGNLVR